MLEYHVVRASSSPISCKRKIWSFRKRSNSPANVGQSSFRIWASKDSYVSSKSCSISKSPIKARIGWIKSRLPLVPWIVTGLKSPRKEMKAYLRACLWSEDQLHMSTQCLFTRDRQLQKTFSIKSFHLRINMKEWPFSTGQMRSVFQRINSVDLLRSIKLNSSKPYATWITLQELMQDLIVKYSKKAPYPKVVARLSSNQLWTAKAPIGISLHKKWEQKTLLWAR